MKKISPMLMSWLEEKKLSIFQLLSMAFVPLRTFEDIRDGKRYVASLFRLYSFTELDEFKLSEEEMQKYENIKKSDQQIQADEMISGYFLKQWTDHGKLPEEIDSLSFSSKKKQDKIVLSRTLLKKFFTNKKKPVQTSSSLETNRFLDLTIVTLKEALGSDPTSCENFSKRNGPKLKDLSSLLNILFGENPTEVYNLFISKENLFNPKNH